MDEGPVQGISTYEHAEEALFRYLKLAETRAETLKHIWHVLNIEMFLEDDDLEMSNKEELLHLCAEIKSREVWRDKVMAAMTSTEAENFFYANNVASRLDIDVTALIEKTLPLDEMASGMGDYLFSPTLHDTLKTVSIGEINEDTKKRMAKLIRGKRLTEDD